MLNLTTKEGLLLEGEKSHEDLCVKYNNYLQKLLILNLKIYLVN